jgi:hypothetical protein
MHNALGHGQRTVSDVDGQEQPGHRVDGHPDPVGGAADFPVLDRTEQGVEFIQLDLGNT